ncbi:MAG: 2-dehydropantoate 2-reductase [Rhizobiaceae bacterium]|nr:2-dehydropantoate 2-reductase [Rhizobiaceae bacterium]
MRIAFMGSGGLGGYFGARLCAGDCEVHFIARGRHLQAMRDEGLRIEGPNAMHIARVNATDDPREVGVVDFVMLCVKLWDTEQALRQIRPMVGPATTIISFQNGVLKDQDLRAAFDESQIMGGVAYVATTVDRPGVVRQTGPMQRLIFGLSGTTTTIRKPIGPIREHPQTRAFLLDVMREVVAVGRAHGADLAEDYARVRLELADGVAYDMTSSMHHDLERGNALEVRWLAGGVVELGRRAGVPTPLNRAIADILALHEGGTR